MSRITNGTDFIIACESGLQCADTCIEINIWRLFQASRYGPGGLLLQNILPVRRMVIPRVGFRFRMEGYDEMTEPGKSMGRRGPTALLAGGLDALHAGGVGMLSCGVGVLSFQFISINADLSKARLPRFWKLSQPKSPMYYAEYEATKLYFLYTL